MTEVLGLSKNNTFVEYLLCVRHITSTSLRNSER